MWAPLSRWDHWKCHHSWWLWWTLVLFHLAESSSVVSEFAGTRHTIQNVLGRRRCSSLSSPFIGDSYRFKWFPCTDWVAITILFLFSMGPWDTLEGVLGTTCMVLLDWKHRNMTKLLRWISTKNHWWGREDGLKVKIAGCSSEGPRFNSQHLHGSTRLSVTSGLCGHQTHLGRRHTCRQNSCI